MINFKSQYASSESPFDLDVHFSQHNHHTHNPDFGTYPALTCTCNPSDGGTCNTCGSTCPASCAAGGCPVSDVDTCATCIKC